MLQRLATTSKKPVSIQVDAYDILRDPRHDLLHDDLRKEILKKLENGYYDAVIASPPCGTWSRAPWANVQGPRPLRSSVHPYGFPWLEGWKLLKVTQSNSMVELSLQAFTICMKQDILFLFEHPEDLGDSSDMRPASVWQLLPICNWVAAGEAFSGAFFQCYFGASSPKPTRLLHNIVELNDHLWPGMPQLDAVGAYQGPLPPHCGCTAPHQTLIRKTSEGAFATTAAAAYPPAMDAWLARCIFSPLLKRAERRASAMSPSKGAPVASLTASLPRV